MTFSGQQSCAFNPAEWTVGDYRWKDGDFFMTLDEFQDCLDRLGDDLALWPAEQAGPGRDLLAGNASARAMLREAKELRTLFAAEAPVHAPAGLAARIVEAAMRAKAPAKG